MVKFSENSEIIISKWINFTKIYLKTSGRCITTKTTKFDFDSMKNDGKSTG
jgi:hypothetical protein